MAEADRREKVRTAASVILATVATAIALFLGREFFQPIAIAVLLSALFRPVVRAMEKAKLPTPLAAAVVVLGLIAALGVGIYALAGPVKNWFDTAPQSLATAQQKLERFRKPVQQVNEVAAKLQQAAQGPSSQPASSQPTTGPSSPGESSTSQPAANQPAAAPLATPAPPEPQGTSLLVRIFGGAATFISGVVEVLLTLYLLLAAGDLFLQKLLKLMHGQRDKGKARKVVHDMESVVARYMLVTLLINIGQGIAVAIALKLLGMPHWMLWGLLTIALEFIPYLGGAVMVGLLLVSAFTAFDSIGRILAAPAIYLLITTIQNNVVSPYAYGNRLRLNPVAVLIGVILWWFLWGIPGAFVAVPILAAVKVVSDENEGLKPVGEFLGE